jgi:hypothetical protein
VFVYGIANPGVGELVAVLVFVSLGLLHLGAGFVSRSWLVLLLLPLAVLIAAPAGYPDSSLGEDLPIWFGVAFLEVFGLPVMAAGVAGAKLAARRHRLRP